jgi:hypothetical protein
VPEAGRCGPPPPSFDRVELSPRNGAAYLEHFEVHTLRARIHCEPRRCTALQRAKAPLNRSGARARLHGGAVLSHRIAKDSSLNGLRFR